MKTFSISKKMKDEFLGAGIKNNNMDLIHPDVINSSCTALGHNVIRGKMHCSLIRQNDTMFTNDPKTLVPIKPFDHE